MNKVILLGRLTKDPEIRYTQSADPVCIARFTVAVNKRFKKEGEPDADFISCVAFKRTAEFLERYIKKGMQVSLAGSISVRFYDDNSGQRRWITEVNADEINFTESKAAYESRGHDNSATTSESNGFDASNADFTPIAQSIDEDDDLPF
ncbi:MAG: single-stranded DNA-binding protein [Defluviitaleaceae bacterium]|nr:single-stranded DNA-binding protein [Defluviitaleaceae bacterium]